MAGTRISVRIDEDLRSRLEAQASATGKKPSQVVREALQQHLPARRSGRRRKRLTAYDLALKTGFIGAAGPGLRPDLKTNKKQRSNAKAAATRKKPSDIVRDALEDRRQKPRKKRTVYDAFLEAGLIGAIKGLPPDLSTNKKYFEGFGESRDARADRCRSTDRRSKRR